MAATFKTLYGTSNQALTITLASLASSATVGRESTVVDNTTNLFLDALLFIEFETGTVATNKQALVYVYGTADGGTTYTEAATGTDASFTRKDPTTLRPLAVIPAVTNSFVHKAGPFSIAQAFGGVLPAKWGIVFCNDTGAALSGTAGNNKAFYQGIQAQSV
jgi:hypothetical protein